MRAVTVLVLGLVVCLRSAAADRPGFSRLTLTMTGAGSFSPNLNDRLLKIGSPYKITARPGTGFVFSNWTGAVESSVPQLVFVMQSNLVLHANFVANPFPPVKGNSAGLYYDASGVSYESLSAAATSRSTRPSARPLSTARSRGCRRRANAETMSRALVNSIRSALA